MMTCDSLSPLILRQDTAYTAPPTLFRHIILLVSAMHYDQIIPWRVLLNSDVKTTPEIF